MSLDGGVLCQEVLHLKNQDFLSHFAGTGFSLVSSVKFVASGTTFSSVFVLSSDFRM